MFDEFYDEGPTCVAQVTTRRRPGGMGFLAAAKKPGAKKGPVRKPKKKPFRSPGKWKG